MGKSLTLVRVATRYTGKTQEVLFVATCELSGYSDVTLMYDATYTAYR